MFKEVLGARPEQDVPENAAQTQVTLYHLDLSYNNLDAASCKVIAEGLRDNHHLYGLHIVGNAAIIDADGFLSPNVDGVPSQVSRPSPRCGAQPQRYGELRQGNEDRLGASSRPTTADVSGQAEASMWSDEDVLRERDVLEQQTTCWACEGWERHELVWQPAADEQKPQAVWAFTSIDGFRAGLRLKEEQRSGEREALPRFVAARMIPRSCRVLVIFQVDCALRTPAGCEIEDLETPAEIELRACEELPILAPPSDQEVVLQEARRVSKSLEHRLVLRMPKAAVLHSAPDRGAGAAQRSVLLDGPDGVGPVQMPRITESEFRMRTKPPRGPAFYATFRHESEKVVQACFLLDWSRAKVARLVSKDAERQESERLIATNYRQLVALYRDLSCIGTTGETGFGVTQLEASTLLTQAGLVDDTTRVSDIDRCFIASKVLPVDLRKAGVRLANDKVLNRHQFLELLLRVADQRYVQTGSFHAPEVEMQGKTVLITGPSRGGIGFETALALARQGATLLLAARNVEKATADAEAIASQIGSGQKPEVFKCDVSSTESTRECAEQILKAYPVIDVLINNAGAVFDEEKKVESGVEISFATCVLGHHLLNHMLKPRRLVWVTGDIYAISDGSADPYFKGKGIPAYANACLARLMLAREIRRRGLCDEIVAVHPGVIRSQFIKPKGCLQAAMVSSYDWGRISVVAGAQSSIFAASCPASDLHQETVYFHNKYGWYVLSPTDLARNEGRCQALFDECASGNCKAKETANPGHSKYPVAEAKMAEQDGFLAALHTEEVDDVMKKYHAVLQEVYRRFSGRVSLPGVAKFMSFGEFQELLESSHSLTAEFTQRRIGLAFRMAMMTQADEMFKTRFQEMSFVEFQHAVGAVVFLRGGQAHNLAALVEAFIREKLLPIARGR
ncbi:unnamed protein product [Symbiodinium natans]|uniref:Ketoreductase domain-containing protein n=1 Tax=Symbiodinium natans TaxID=878477 RepID=A0A812HMJ0_9DINO|nr:unnamed protein product [Symbiodinium natans]